jgi:hypothetical protein
MHAAGKEMLLLLLLSMLLLLLFLCGQPDMVMNCWH